MGDATSKPFISIGGSMEPNPGFNPTPAEGEAKEEKIRRGTSFFLNFDPLCSLHQISGEPGDLVREEMAHLLSKRFVHVFANQFSYGPSAEREFKRILRVAICPTPQKGFNNGEIYFWTPGILLDEDCIFAILSDFKNSLKGDPIKVKVGGKEYEVKFYGWGFRYC